MPDPQRKTISATQAPALFNASPYATRWMLHRHFSDGMEIESTEDARMSWGKKLQPLVLAQAAEDLAMEVHPHDETYVRRGQLGATRDAIVIAPDVGPGALETKCVFDYRNWMSEWGGGRVVPRHHEIQLQQQMLVGSGDGEPYRWGVVAAWVAGEVHYFKRAPVPALWEALQKEAAAFFEAIAAGHEPDPFGAPVELPFLSALKRPEGKVVDRSTGAGSDDLATAARLLDAASREASAAERVRKACKAKLLAAAGDAETLRLAGGAHVTFKTVERNGFTVKPSTYTKIDVYVPSDEGMAGPELKEAFERSVLEAG